MIPQSWKDILCSWIGRINIIKMAILPKAVYRFSAFHIQINTQDIFHRTRTNNPKIYMGPQNPHTSKTGGMTLPVLRLYYKIKN